MIRSSGPLTVVVHHEADLTRAGLRAVIGTEPDLAVLGDTGRVDEMVGMVGRLRPDVLMTSMDGIGEFEPLGRLCAHWRRRPPVVVLVDDYDESAVIQVLRLGLRGIVHNDHVGRFVVDAVRAVARGEAFLAPAATSFLLDRLVESLPDAEAVRRIEHAELTGREREVLRLVAEGLTTSEMALKLGVTAGTVKSHLSRVLNKLGMRERGQAAALAHRARITQEPVTHASRRRS
ncbi:LuxR C-terminal-related transcriptional regulator [Symbioplanes lichenis]|uniref:LuxR C-terminal-related transcriptional regulator n=1 Tax=Symbioplanes lichenis TaxID=1629072 RepID=UPI00273889C4|nr:response regulator transcription factor [Actinoplanes lichenis]